MTIVLAELLWNTQGGYIPFSYNRQEQVQFVHVPLVLWAGLIRRIPNISKAYTGVEPKEHNQRQTDVAQYCPSDFSVKSISVIKAVWRFVSERVEYPHGDVGDEKKHEDLAAWFFSSQFLGVTAAAESVHYQWNLDYYL